MPKVKLRTEQSSDIDVIHSVTKKAFRGKPYAGGNEQDIVDRLRENGDLSLSLVALISDSVIGHIAFSPALADDDSGPWSALGPVSVVPEHQGAGVGSQLIHEGLELIKTSGAVGCMLTGNPNYYQRFGFEFATDNVPAGESNEHFMLKLFTGVKPKGPMRFNHAFYEGD